jgi:hypothetical protein
MIRTVAFMSLIETLAGTDARSDEKSNIAPSPVSEVVSVLVHLDHVAGPHRKPESLHQMHSHSVGSGMMDRKPWRTRSDTRSILAAHMTPRLSFAGPHFVFVHGMHSAWLDDVQSSLRRNRLGRRCGPRGTWSHGKHNGNIDLFPFARLQTPLPKCC